MTIKQETKPALPANGVNGGSQDDTKRTLANGSQEDTKPAKALNGSSEGIRPAKSAKVDDHDVTSRDFARTDSGIATTTATAATDISPKTEQSDSETTPVVAEAQEEDFTSIEDEEAERERREAAEARSKRLAFLLEKSGVYARLIGDRMEKQRQDRLEKESKRAVVKPAAAPAPAPAPTTTTATATRTSARTNGKRTAPEEPTAKQQPPSKRSKRGGGRDTKAEEAEPEKVAAAAAPPPSSANEATGEKKTESGGTYIGQQPALITGATLRDYQLAGVQWMVSLYENGLNGILADEMGLGKTIQTISFLAYLMGKGSHGPFLIVCPLSVLANWVTEFEKFAPTIPVLMYHGTKEEREEMRGQMRQTNGDAKRTPKYPVIVTTYEMVVRDAKFLAKTAWKFIVVDEGHRLKNLNCKLIQELKTYKSANRLLLTGTPLHNNLAELWSLLNFILPDIFDDLDTFQEWFDFDGLRETGNVDGIDRAEVVTSLHSILKPFLLRRLKVDVEPDLPRKKEYVLYAPLTQQQTDMYRAIVNRDIRNYLIDKKTGWSTPASTQATTEEADSQSATDDESISARSSRRLAKRPRVDYHVEESDRKWLKEVEAGKLGIEKPPPPVDTKEQTMLKRATSAVNNMKLKNVVMQLRKVSNHPFLFDWPIDPETGDYVVNDDLIDASGKMLLLRRLLDALFERGHKVLLFSQFATMLDVIQDWATEYAGLKVFRIDGSTPQVERRSQMKEFNQAGDDPDACRLFLLSTRAGGLGINLVAADTVIFFDQDWNPQQDLQAADRAHRIGQTKPVLVFRLVSAQTIESKILQKAGMKRKLEALVISKGKFQHVDKDGKILLGREAKGKVMSVEEISRQMLALDNEQINIASKDDQIISDADLEMLLDRSDEAFDRDQSWSSSALGKKSAAKGEKTAFEVFVPAQDDTNDGLAKMFGGEGGDE